MLIKQIICNHPVATGRLSIKNNNSISNSNPKNDNNVFILRYDYLRELIAIGTPRSAGALTWCSHVVLSRGAHYSAESIEGIYMVSSYQRHNILPPLRIEPAYVYHMRYSLIRFMKNCCCFVNKLTFRINCNKTGCVKTRVIRQSVDTFESRLYNSHRVIWGIFSVHILVSNMADSFQYFSILINPQ